MDVGDNSRKAASKVTDKYKKRRQMLRSIRKNSKKYKSYFIAGAFTNKSVPEIDFTNQPEPSEPVLKKKKISVPITFIDENDITVVTCLRD